VTAASQTSQTYMLPETSSFIAAIEIFDGSSIVDPIVVSNVYWASLQGKILAVIIGQTLAAVTFAILSSFFATQVSQLGDFVSKTPFKAPASTGKPFIKLSDTNNSPTPDFGRLLICLTIDIIGSSSEIVPLLGDLTDVVYAPIAATLLRSIYGSNVIFALEFAEELLPFTDILPLATIW
jgi:hypothetical protein